MGLSQTRRFQNYHRVLNRAAWSSREASGLLLVLLVHTFAPFGPLVLGLDDTLERRRWGARPGQRDLPGRSAFQPQPFRQSQWPALAVLDVAGSHPWAGRVWALPFLTVLAPSERYHQERGQSHKKLTDWARQMLLQVRRWFPKRALVGVGDSSYATLELLHPSAGSGHAFANLWPIPLPSSPACGWMRPSMRQPRRGGQGRTAGHG
jgi:hypothetical protein